MKSIFTFFLSVLFTIAAMAAPKADARREGKLTVSIEGYSDVRVDMDGRTFTSGDNQLVIRDLDPGYHDVIIYKESQNFFDKVFGKHYDVVYNGSLIIRSGTHVQVSVDRFGRTRIDESKMQFKQRGNDWYDADDDWRNGNGRYDDYRNGGRTINGIFARPMFAPEFERVKQMLRREYSESSRVISASQIMETNYFTSAQVREIICLFAADNNKVKLAKKAYTKTIDPQNYDLVLGEIHVRAARESLREYMFRYKR